MRLRHRREALQLCADVADTVCQVIERVGGGGRSEHFHADVGAEVSPCLDEAFGFVHDLLYLSDGDCRSPVTTVEVRQICRGLV